MLIFALGFSAFLFSLVLTPLFRDWFIRFKLVDHPDGHRKLHNQPIPHMGGVPIALSCVLAGAALPLFDRQILAGAPLILKLIPAVCLVFITGLADDLFKLRPWQKLLGQVGAAILAYLAGVQITGVAGYTTPGWLSFAVTIIWLIGCTNAFNLIDGVDGLASGVGLFATVTTLMAGLVQHNVPLVLATAPLAGALLGFLRYNFSPATIFLGDCGSLFIGFILGCYGVIWSQKSATLLGMTAPLMALAIPLLDTTLAIVRRFLRGQPILGGDRNHIHHRLLDRGLSPRSVALLLYGVCSIAALFSLLQSVVTDKYAGMVIVVFCLVAWIGIQHLGYTEFGTARQLLAQGTFRRILDAQISLNNFELALGKAATDEESWSLVHDTCRQYGFAYVKLRLNGQTFDEQLKEDNGSPQWTIRIPLSGVDYVNLSHECEPSGESLMVLTPLIAVLQRGLRVHSTPPEPESEAVVFERTDRAAVQRMR